MCLNSHVFLSSISTEEVSHQERRRKGIDIFGKSALYEMIHHKCCMHYLIHSLHTQPGRYSLHPTGEAKEA